VVVDLVRSLLGCFSASDSIRPSSPLLQPGERSFEPR